MRFLQFVMVPILALSMLCIEARSEPGQWPNRPSPGITLPCKVINVVDGDTVDVQIVQIVRIRLLECWAPESRTRNAEEKARGIAAKVHLQTVATAKPGTAWIPTGQTFAESLTLDRVLGHVWIDGRPDSLSELQVSSGHASRTRPPAPPGDEF